MGASHENEHAPMPSYAYGHGGRGMAGPTQLNESDFFPKPKQWIHNIYYGVSIPRSARCIVDSQDGLRLEFLRQIEGRKGRQTGQQAGRRGCNRRSVRSAG